MSKSPGYSKYNALLDSENSETESDTNKPGIFSLSNNQCYQETSALTQLQKEEEHKIIEHGKEEAIKKITDEEIKSQCAESGFLIYFCFQLNFISKKFQ
jgi:hypothetical protein